MGVPEALLAGSAVLGAAGAIQEGNAKSDALQYQAQVAANNAIIQRQNKEWAQQTGAAQGAALDAKTRAGVASIKTGQAASGVDVNTGSAVDVRASAAAIGELDALTQRSNTARKVYGYDVAGQSQDAQAALDRSSADSAESAGVTKAFTSLLSSATSAYGGYSKWQAAGGTGGVASWLGG